MDTLSTSALSMANWVTSPHGDRAPTVSSPTKTPLHYLTGLFNYWQNISRHHTSRASRRYKGEASQATDEICYFEILPVRMCSNILYNRFFFCCFTKLLNKQLFTLIHPPHKLSPEAVGNMHVISMLLFRGFAGGVTK